MHAVMVLFVIFHSANVNNHHSTVIDRRHFHLPFVLQIIGNVPILPVLHTPLLDSEAENKRSAPEVGRYIINIFDALTDIFYLRIFNRTIRKCKNFMNDTWEKISVRNNCPKEEILEYNY